jgi:chemotaxis protein methyltransferase CheR
MSSVDDLWAVIEQQFGLAPGNGCRTKLQHALADLARNHHLTEGDAILRTAHDAKLLADLVGSLTVKESHFFRHSAHFEAIVEAARQRLALPNRWYCVWSAGCAQGEEPYSVAIALRDGLSSSELARVAICATDVDRSAIASAQTGLYSRWAFRSVPPGSLGRHCFQRVDGRYQLAANIRRQVAFRHGSVQQQLRTMPQASLDAVLFRNVSIYLTAQATAGIYQELERVLRPGGLLLVAPTDARPRLAAFSPIAAGDATVFRRSELAPPVQPPSLDLGPDVSTTPKSTGGPAPLAPSHPPAAFPPTLHSPDPDWGSIDELGNRGDLAAALTLITERLTAGSEPVSAYTRRGRLHLALGNAVAAVEDFRRVLYFDPHAGAVRYWYALALRQAGRREAARSQLGLIAEDPGTSDAVLRDSALALIGELE